MKRLFKVLGILVLLLLLILGIMALTQPKDVTIVRTATIKASQAAVFHQIQYFRNWPNWSPWVDVEPNVKLSYNGVDGMPGSSYKWLGDETGAGKMTATAISEGQMDFSLLFLKPWEGAAEGFLKTEAIGPEETKVIWSMTTHASFPFNAFNFITDHMIGRDFDRGLVLLGKYLQSNPEVPLSLNSVKEQTFKGQLFATVRKTVLFSELQSFSSKAFTELAAAAKDRITGPASSFYYTWDDASQTSDMAPAFPVMGSDPISLIGSTDKATMVMVPESNECLIVYKGGYANLSKAHEILGQYIVQKRKKLNFVLEEYIIGPATEADSNKWVTNINYLVD